MDSTKQTHTLVRKGNIATQINTQTGRNPMKDFVLFVIMITRLYWLTLTNELWNTRVYHHGNSALTSSK